MTASIFASGPPEMLRAFRLARGCRLETFAWLVTVLEQNSGRPWWEARQALDAAILPGRERDLDDAATLIPALEQAALALGVQGIALRLHGGAVH